MKLSIVVPCYNEEESLAAFYDAILKIKEELNSLSIELIFVDDGSKDGTLKEIKRLKEMSLDSSNHKNKGLTLRYLSFSRNFGKESALLAGLELAQGDFIATMDADLQDPPSLLPAMLESVRQGEYDCAATRRISREGEPPIRSFFARKFYKLMAHISDANIVDGARDYRLMSRQMTEAILSLKERNRFSKGIFSWVGFKTKWFEYTNVERVAGETKWSFWKLFLYSLDGITAFSAAPLMIASLLGIFLSFMSVIFIILIIGRTLIFGDPVPGWPSIACLVLFVGGIQLLCIGILGQYLAKTYTETKNRPLYIIKEKI